MPGEVSALDADARACSRFPLATSSRAAAESSADNGLIRAVEAVKAVQGRVRRYVNFQSRPRLSRGCGRRQLYADRLQPRDERLLFVRGNRARSTLIDIQIS